MNNDMDPNKIEKAVHNYIRNTQIDFAIMISGEWGIGKTYFLKNTLFSKFKEEDYKVIYISLIGSSDEQNLKDNIYKKINPFYFSNEKSKIKNIIRSKSY